MSLCVDSRELGSSHVTITVSELVAFPPAVHFKTRRYHWGQTRYNLEHFVDITTQSNQGLRMSTRLPSLELIISTVRRCTVMHLRMETNGAELAPDFKETRNKIIHEMNHILNCGEDIKYEKWKKTTVLQSKITV